MHNIHFYLLPSGAPSLSFSLPPFCLSLSFTLLLAIRLNPTTRGFRGYSSKFKLSSKWFFSINASWRIPTSTSFVPCLNRSFSLLHFSLPVTYPFLPVPSSFVWRVIKLATSDGGFNWFRSVCVECKRTRRTLSVDISQNDILCCELFREISWSSTDKKYFKTRNISQNICNYSWVQISLLNKFLK